jgi:nitroreductase
MPNSPAKAARPDHPILTEIVHRYSPYVYEPRAVEKPKLLACLEAARWAASSFNEQPWSFIMAVRDDAAEFKKALDCLMEANQVWAKDAGVLILTVIAKNFTKNNSPNRVAQHDLGIAAGYFSLQAVKEGLQAHQMAGVNLAKVRQVYNVPDTHEPMTAIALGYAADPSKAANADLGKRDLAPRDRKPLKQWVFTGGWQKPAKETV